MTAVVGNNGVFKLTSRIELFKRVKHRSPVRIGTARSSKEYVQHRAYRRAATVLWTKDLTGLMERDQVRWTSQS